jgi:hypothetical protein
VLTGREAVIIRFILASAGPITIASGQSALNWRKMAFGLEKKSPVTAEREPLSRVSPWVAGKIGATKLSIRRKR